jgi:hypothetical protein
MATTPTYPACRCEWHAGEGFDDRLSGWSLLAAKQDFVALRFKALLPTEEQLCDSISDQVHREGSEVSGFDISATNSRLLCWMVQQYLGRPLRNFPGAMKPDELS